MSELLVKTAVGHTWFWATVALLVSAVVCHWIGLWHNGRFLTTYTHALMEKTLEQNQAIIDHYRHLMKFWGMVGLVLVMLGIGCWLISWKRQEPGRSSVVVALLAMYVLSLLLII
jgi:membrane protein DedA with SNARE-associated domain